MLFDWGSRESDSLFEGEAAMAVNGAILVSFWHLPGMKRDSGTPTEWLAQLSDNVVQVHCDCPVEVAARRFFERQRHPGHLDETSYEQLLARIEELEKLGLPKIGRLIQVDTTVEIDFEDLVRSVRS